MFGIDVVDFVPAGTIEDMVQNHGPELVTMAMQAARSKFDVAADERISFQFIETVRNGKPTVILLPLVLDATTLQTKRKLPYYDVPTFLRTAPIAEWIRAGKETKKTIDKVEQLLKQVETAKAKGDAYKVAKLNADLERAFTTLPPGVRNLIGLSVAVEQVKEATSAVDKALEQIIIRRDEPVHAITTTTATETGDEAPGIAATDEPTTTTTTTTDEQ